MGYFSTHSFPLTFILNFLKNHCPRSQVLFLGVQPKKVSFGEGLSLELQEAEEQLRNFLIEILGGK